MKDLHTAYVGMVVSVSGDKATVQPLGLIKEYGGSTKKQAVVPNVPIAACKCTPIKEGDLVVCICCDRNITDALKGVNALPPAGDHSLSDSIIIGVLPAPATGGS